MTGKFTFLPPKDITPGGWLRKQLEIQAAGLAGNLDLIWPDVRDSKWIGGCKEGWERVPYWLDGFIPLAYLLRNPSMINRAQRYVEAILAQQCPDGWLCPCTQEERGSYDTWALLLISKVLVVYAECSGDAERVDAALRAALRNFAAHLDEHPLFNWGRYRWFEGLIAIDWLRRRKPEPWLTELARKLHDQGFDYATQCDQWHWTAPETCWTYDGHVVNHGMALKAGALYALFDDAKRNREQPRRLLELLRKYHWMPHGHFTGSECLAGMSPIQGSELCGVVEAMYSEEWLLALTGEPEWGDWLETLAYNALPATCSPDMWTHQYVQQPNQIGCVPEPKDLWTTNREDAHIFGLEPNYGCCTANMGQGWPKLALATFMQAEDGLFSAVLAPSTARFLAGEEKVPVTCQLKTAYPFGDSLEYMVTAEAPVDFALHIRIPGFAKSAAIDGNSVPVGEIATVKRLWKGTTTLRLDLELEPVLTPCPGGYGLSVLRRGALLFALPLAAQWIPVEYCRDDVERKFPYCDYHVTPTEPWAFAFARTPEFSVSFSGDEALEAPFSDEKSPIAIDATMVPVSWKLKESHTLVCKESPESNAPTGPACRKKLVPYGCTTLRMTEMPIAD